MNTKLVMSLSALVMGITGILLSFMPSEIAGLISQEAGNYVVLLQVTGAMYFAFAMMNWTARANLIGGIYARPIAIANLTHFVMGALALGKYYFIISDQIILIAAMVYLGFAVLFTKIFFTHPVSEATSA
jgi:hypothetical protein